MHRFKLQIPWKVTWCADEFPDPEPYEVDGLQHYKAGNDPTEKYLPSELEDPERSHNIPFPPSAQTAKNMGLTIKCVECEKRRLLHSKHKLKEQQVKTLKSFLSKIIYICGSTLSEYEGPEGWITLLSSGPSKACMRALWLWRTGRTLNILEINYPKCSQCGSKDDVPRRKRKIVTAEDLARK